MEFAISVIDDHDLGRRVGLRDPDNYRLISAGLNGDIESNPADVCAAGVSGDDHLLSIDYVVIEGYSRVSIYVNGATRVSRPSGQIYLKPPLSFGRYALVVCGSLVAPGSIRSVYSQPLDGNSDGEVGDDFFVPFFIPSMGVISGGEFCFPIVTRNDSNALLCI